MKKVKVQKRGVIKTINENLLPTYLAMGWTKIELNTLTSQFTKIK